MWIAKSPLTLSNSISNVPGQKLIFLKSENVYIPRITFSFHGVTNAYPALAPTRYRRAELPTHSPPDTELVRFHRRDA